MCACYKYRHTLTELYYGAAAGLIKSVWFAHRRVLDFHRVIKTGKYLSYPDHKRSAKRKRRYQIRLNCTIQICIHIRLSRSIMYKYTVMILTLNHVHMGEEYDKFDLYYFFIPLRYSYTNVLFGYIDDCEMNKNTRSVEHTLLDMTIYMMRYSKYLTIHT
jgi:hypothetical protein